LSVKERQSGRKFWAKQDKGGNEKWKGRLTLIIWHFVASLVHAQKGEIAVLAHGTILDAVDEERLVARLAELLLVSIVNAEGDRLATKPNVQKMS
jgi:hypothetical protein